MILTVEQLADPLAITPLSARRRGIA